MKLPQNAVEAGETAIQGMWEDRAAITRRVTEGNARLERLLYSDIPCHLSASALPLTSQTENEARAEPSYTLYVGKGTDIKPGDALTVYHKGQTVKGRAGIPFRRNFSLVVPLKEMVIA